MEADVGVSPDAGLLGAVDAAEELTGAQRRALAEIYRAYVDANAAPSPTSRPSPG